MGTPINQRQQYEQKSILQLYSYHAASLTVCHRLAPLAILFQFQTGLRLGELTAIRYEDIETSGCIHIQRMYRPRTKEVVEHTKNHIDRKAVLTDKAKRLIHIAKVFQEQQDTDIVMALLCS